MANLPTRPNRIALAPKRLIGTPPKTVDPIYLTPEYQVWRDIVVGRAGGYCQDPLCKTPHRKPSRLFADHVHELRDGGAPFDPANGLARCGSCHSRVTAERRAVRMGLADRPMGGGSKV